MTEDTDPIPTAMIGHDDIMRMSKELRRPAGTLIVLKDHLDPFNADTPGKRQAAEWFAENYRQFGFAAGIHLRRIHYRLVSQETPVLDWDGRPYENTHKCFCDLCNASLTARYLSLVPMEDFVDRRNPDPVLRLENAQESQTIETVPACLGDFPSLELSYGELPALGLAAEQFPDLDLPTLGKFEATAVQPYHVEIWCEKTTVADILDDIAERYGLNVVYGMGELSLTACCALMRRVAGNGDRPVRVLYLSDFDPAGQSMPVAVARKLEWLIRRDNPEIDLQLRPIFLNHDQCVELRLPRTPIKETEGRGARFEERFGEGATELDALEAIHPGLLGQVIEREVERYYDDDADEKWDEIETSVNEELDRATEEVHAAHAESIDPIAAEHDAITATAEELRAQARRAIAPIVVQYERLIAEAGRLRQQAKTAIEDIVDEYETDVIEAAEELYDRAEMVFADVTDDLENAAEQILANMEKIEPEGDEDEDPLFDSTREYVEQVDRFKKHQGKPTTRAPRASQKGKVLSAETRAKMRAAHQGKPKSKETRAKMRAAAYLRNRGNGETKP